MAIQLSTVIRNAMLNAIEVGIGADSVRLRILSGAAPANVAAAETGDLLANVVLPADWMDGATGGAKEMLGTWEDTSADATGTAGYFRLGYLNGEGVFVPGIQGTITEAAGGGDMIVTDVDFVAGQKFVVTEFTLTAANA